ncbi:CarD family transcriptional regulator [Nocardioides dongkuii]|uniref:CarD family transcriptional regulator n=1 Tax=Nocardioides dongkuii TaxID=2760089 RepID=UPI0015F8C3A9|nr:CarD family transcriptional regulator [Nocardioides dongkuii]
MTTSSAPKRRHLASSPFKPDPEPVIEEFAIGDHVSHDAYGVGRVVGLEAHAVTVDFGNQTVRVPSPFSKMTTL